MKQEVETVLEHTVGPSSYHRDDSLSASVLQHYRHSLERIVAIASNAGVRVIFVNTPSNLKDCSPFKSEHSATLTESEKRDLQDLFQQGNLHLDQGDYEAALDIYRQALEIDNRFSHLLYQMGQVLLKLERHDEAREYLIRAKDEDVCPLRALSPMLDILREVSLQERLPFIDWNRFLEAKSEEEKGHRILGEEEFLDHVHLTIESHRLLALEIISAMAAEISYGIPEDWSDVNLKEITQARMERLDTTAHAGALHNLAKVYNWAGKHEDAVNVALKGLALDSTHEEAVTSSIMVGTFLHRQGKLEEALPHYQRALDMDVNNFEANKFAGRIYTKWQENEKALRHFLLAVNAQPEDQEIRYEAGLSYLRLKRPTKALDHFTFLVERSPQSHKFRYGLGLALYRIGRIQAAEGEWNHILRLDPKHRGALKGLEMIRTDERHNGSKGRSDS
jgi:tetratricopeptide (TPR) repeat protein